jgi:hypothetical protein
MSESVSAGSTSGASTGASSAAASSPAPSSPQNASPNPAGAPSAQGSSPNPAGNPNPNTQATPNPADNDFEEIKLGSISGKVPKKLAEAVKAMERGFQTKAQKAAQLEKLIELAQNNPKEFYSKNGKDPYSLAEELLAEKYEMMTMTPEQRKIAELEQWKSNQEKIDRQSKSEIVDQLKEFYPEMKDEEFYSHPREKLVEALTFKRAQEEQVHQNLQKEIIDAWKESGLPKHKYFAALMSFTMLNHQRATKTPLQASQAAARVKQDFMNSSREIADQMDAKAILEWLGDSNIKKVREHLVEQVTGKPISPTNQNNGPANAASPKKQLNEFEWRKAMGLT